VIFRTNDPEDSAMPTTTPAHFIARFVADERGAITVDWTVLTASLAGLGLASMGVVSGGVQNLSTDIGNHLSTNDWNLFDNGMIPGVSLDFTGGDMTGWFGGQVMDMGGEIGELLVVGAGEVTGFLMEVAEGTEQAVMQFDLIAGDSLDYNPGATGYDTATLTLNGVTVAIATDGNQHLNFQIPQVDGTTVEATVMVANAHLGGSAKWQDGSASVTIIVDDPTHDLHFELQSNANQGINDEFWGIDNFETATSGATGF
jgi:Flp pilus assembly pilin Flp